MKFTSQPIILRTALSSTDAQPITATHHPPLPPDGLSITVASSSRLVRPQSRSSDVGESQFAVPVMLAARQPLILIVSPESNTPDLYALVDLLRRSPGKYNYGAVGKGTLSHLAMELFLDTADLEAVHIKFSSAGQLFQALKAGDILVACLPAWAMLNSPQHTGTEMLAQSWQTRVALLPDVPTFSELGLSRATSSLWVGITTTAEVASSRAEDLFEGLSSLFNMASAQATIDTWPVVPGLEGPVPFAATLAAETARWSELIQRRSLVLD